MTTTYKQIPAWGSPFWQDPVAAVASLPTTDPAGTVRLTLDTGTIYEWNGSSWNSVGSASEVIGPGSSTDNAIARFDGTTGHLLQNSAVTIDDSGNAAGFGTIASGEVTPSSLTASRALISGASKQIQSATTTSTEIGYVNGVTSAIQTQIDGKQATITGAATTIVSSNLATSVALQSDGSGKVAASSVTSTELGYVSGVTSAIQTQIEAKAAGAASSTDTALAVFSGTGGKTLINSTVTLSSAGVMVQTGTTGAFRMANLTTTQRDALTAANGMIIYNTTTDRPQCYVAGSWTDMIGWGA